MDDGLGNGFITIAGGSLGQYLSTFAIVSKNAIDDGFTFNIKLGNIYRFMYRAQNMIGWSEFSPVTLVFAASIPEAPT